MVLFHDVVQVCAGAAATAPAQPPLLLQFRHYFRVRWIAVHIDDPGPRMAGSLQGSLEEALGGSRVTVSGEQEINAGTARIDRTVQVSPLALYANVSLIHPPGTVGGLQLSATTLLEFWGVALHPTPDRGMVGRYTPFRQEFLDVPIGEGKA